MLKYTLPLLLLTAAAQAQSTTAATAPAPDWHKRAVQSLDAIRQIQARNTVSSPPAQQLYPLILERLAILQDKDQANAVIAMADADRAKNSPDDTDEHDPYLQWPRACIAALEAVGERDQARALTNRVIDQRKQNPMTVEKIPTELHWEHPDEILDFPPASSEKPKS